MFNLMSNFLGSPQYGNSVFYHDLSGHPDKEVGFGAYPLPSVVGLDALADIEVVAEVPALTVIGDSVNGEDLFLAGFNVCSGLGASYAK